VERVTGIEPAWPAWKAGALPLSYTREVLGQRNGRRGTLVREAILEVAGGSAAETGLQIVAPEDAGRA
jgi:hypothetical protein